MKDQIQFSPIKDECVIYKGRRCYVDDIQNGIYKILNMFDKFVYVHISEFAPEPRELYANGYCTGLSWEEEKRLEKVIENTRAKKNECVLLINQLINLRVVIKNDEAVNAVKNSLLAEIAEYDAFIFKTTNIILEGQVPWVSYR